MARLNLEHLRIVKGTAISEKRVVFDVCIGKFAGSRSSDEVLLGIVPFLGN